ASEGFSLALRSRDRGRETLAVFFVQPVDAARCVVRGVLDACPEGHHRIMVLRHHNDRLSALRTEVEAQAALLPPPSAIEPVYERVSDELAELPRLASTGAKAALRVEVARKWQ